MCRIQGRLLRPATLAERRVFLSLGVTALRVPRKYNPFQIARLIRRIALGIPADAKVLRALARKPIVPSVPVPSPDFDTPNPMSEDDGVVAA
jgi:hypothetical protein